MTPAEKATARTAADIHNHLMPGVDDGAVDLDDSRVALEAFRRDGVSLIVTTPHLRGSLTRNPARLEARLAELDDAWVRLVGLAAAELPELRLERGVEVMLDTPDPSLDDERLRLAGAAAVLVEFPYLTVPPRSVNVLSELRMKGFRPVVAHPERYRGLDPALELAGEWRRVGAALQVNAGSLVGQYGAEARTAARRLLERGWIDCLASDYHARGDTRLGAARDWLLDQGGEEQAALLLETNPALLARGEAPRPVPPLTARRGLLSRLAAAFR